MRDPSRRRPPAPPDSTPVVIEMLPSFPCCFEMYFPEKIRCGE